MASTMHEQILENVRRGVVLPIHRDLAPDSNLRAADTFGEEVGFGEADFQRIVSGAIDLVRHRSDLEPRDAVDELVRAFRDAGLPVSGPVPALVASPAASADPEVLDRLFEALDSLASATRDGEVRDRQILDRLDAVAGRAERVARTAATAPASTAAAHASTNEVNEPQPEVTSTKPARVPLDDIQGMIEFLR